MKSGPSQACVVLDIFRDFGIPEMKIMLSVAVS